MSVLQAMVLAMLLEPHFRSVDSPLMMAAVMVSAWFGGFGPGLLATALAGLLRAYFFLPPILSFSLRVEEAVRLSIFVVVALLISSLNEARRRAQMESERLRESERQARLEAEEASRARDDFLAVVSHELMTPLNVVLNGIQVLRKRELEVAAAEKIADMLERNARVLARLIRDMLDSASISRGKVALSLRPVELIPIVEAAVYAVRPLSAAARLSIETEFDPSIGFVTGDPIRLLQIFENLLGNAVKFTPAGGRIRVSVTRLGSLAQVSIRDDGIGISADFLPQVFERFRQAQRPGTGPGRGLGLGLAIVKQLVEMQGGTVLAESAGEGQGATFSVRLALAEVTGSLSRASAAPMESG